MKAKFVQLNEGAWGHFPLDNDVVSDWKWKFGDMILKELKDKIKKGFKSKSYDFDYLYYAIGMWEFFKERLLNIHFLRMMKLKIWINYVLKWLRN